MIRHPIYLVLCVLSAAYLSMADARGLSFWLGLSNGISSHGWSGSHSTFHHK